MLDIFNGLTKQNKTKKKKKKSTLQINKTLLMETSLSLPYLFSN